MAKKAEEHGKKILKRIGEIIKDLCHNTEIQKRNLIFENELE